VETGEEQNNLMSLERIEHPSHTTGSRKGKLGPEYLLMGVDGRGEKIKLQDWI
jgi:hypothetical protein